MAFAPEYRQQVELLIRCLPVLAGVEQFALKGGTAINLFHQDLPRLSVDIDLTYLPIESRDASLNGINDGLLAVQTDLARVLPGAEIKLQGTKNAPKLFIRQADAYIKVEPSPILRGTLEPPEVRTLTPRAQSEFGLAANVNCVAQADLYAGKLCAALDRQHPRDLFDMMLFRQTQDLDAIRPAFVAYLCCHNRPMSELLAPQPQSIETLYQTHFDGMTDPATSLEALLDTRQFLFDWVADALSADERAFLVSVKTGAPDFTLAPYPSMESLPAFKWKQVNIERMSARAHKKALAKLKETLRL
jgi:nucleotidyltransferase AbiEii toxin of type IV toxin-antitoxin system